MALLVDGGGDEKQWYILSNLDNLNWSSLSSLCITFKVNSCYLLQWNVGHS